MSIDTSQAWIEDSMTFGDPSYRGEHSGPVGTPHYFRWIYEDRTPWADERGQWAPCRECLYRAQEETE